VNRRDIFKKKKNNPKRLNGAVHDSDSFELAIFSESVKNNSVISLNQSKDTNFFKYLYNC